MADKFDLRRDIQCHACVSAALYDERAQRWQLHLEDGRWARARCVITAVGLLSAHYIPDCAGLDSFQGPWCHTGKWPAEGLDLAGKRVGGIGTGATGVQLITAIAKDVAHLTVFQRQITVRFPAIGKWCSATAGALVHPGAPRAALAVSPAECRVQSERRGAAPEGQPWLAQATGRRGGGRTAAPAPGQRVVCGSAHAWDSLVLAHQVGQGSGDASVCGSGVTERPRSRSLLRNVCLWLETVWQHP